MGGVVRAIASVALIVVGVVTGNPAAIIAGVSALTTTIITEIASTGPATNPLAQASRLQATIDPGTPRKMVFGKTAMATDVRYQSFTGTDQEYYHQIVCCASHKVTSIEELWLDQELAWSSAYGVASRFSGYLTVVAVLEGSSANAIDIDGNWNAANGCRLTGCAYLHIKYKRTGATKDSDSPFASSITSRMTIVGNGIPVYDARFDSTRGGSGTMRADDQTTWAFSYGSTECGRNPAAQLATFMLGWKIGGKLAVGCGMPSNRVEWSRQITSANVCDESVALAAGGSEKRYRTDLLLGEGDQRGAAFAMWKESCNALLRDAGGKIAFDVLVNDLSSPVLRLTDDDVLSEGTWLQSTSLPEYRNIVRGRYTDPRSSALYQLVDWPQISLTAPDGIDRILAVDLPAVQSVSQAQRIAKQKLQRIQAGGRADGFTFGQRAWAAQVGDCVWWSFSALGFVDKPFRVESLTVMPDGRVPMALTEEKTAFYSWSAEDVAPVTLPTPTTYNWQNEPTIAQLLSSDQGATRNVSQGVHSTSSTYVRGDIVRTADGLASYIAKQAVPTSIALTNTAYWDLFVQGGGGTAGANAFQAMLTNTPITITTAADGSGGSYTAANGYMTLYEGAVNRSASSTYAVVGSPSWASINSTTGYYSITDPGADQASVQFDVSYSGVTYRLTLNVAKVRQGVSGTNGLNAKTLIVISDRQTIAYDGTGALSPSTQTTTFTAQKQNTTGTVSWTISDNLGNTFTPSTYLSATTGDSTTMLAANFSAAIAVNSATGVIVTGTISADSISDKISVVKVQAGSAGTNGAIGASAFTLANVSNMTITTPTSVTKNGGGSAWNGVARTVEGGLAATAGGDITGYMMIGIDTFASNPTDYNGFDYAIHRSSGNIYCYSKGYSPIAGPFSVGTYQRLYVKTDGATVFYMADSTVLHSRALDAGDVGAVFYGLYSTPEVGYVIQNITFSSDGKVGANSKSIILTSTEQTFKASAAGVYVTQTTTFKATRQNSSAQTLWTIYSPSGGVASGGAITATALAALIASNRYFTRVDDDTLTQTQTQFANLIADNGWSSYSLRAQITDGSLFYDQLSVVKVQDGSNGTNGSNGLSIAATKPLISVQCASGGAPISGALPQTTQIILYDGNTDVTASASYSKTQTNCSVTNNGGGSFTVTGMSIGGGTFTITATYGARTITMTIPVAPVEKGQGANSATPVAITALTTSGSYVVCGTLADLSVPAGSTLSGSMNVSYGPTSSGNFAPQVKLTYQNITDSGSETDFTGSVITGGTANSTDPDSVATSGSVVNSAGGTKSFRIRAYSLRASGSGSVGSNVSGTLAGSVS